MSSNFSSISLIFSLYLTNLLLIIYLFVFVDFLRGGETDREREREREREKHQFVVPLTSAFIGWFLYEPWLGIEPAILVYQDYALTNWAAWPGPKGVFIAIITFLISRCSFGRFHICLVFWFSFSSLDFLSEHSKHNYFILWAC